MQREMPVHGEVQGIKDAPAELVRMCDDEIEAVHLCIQLSPHTHDFIGKKLGIDKGHFSRMLSRAAGFPTHKRVQLMELCGNRAPVQFEAMQVGLTDGGPYRARCEQLEAEVAALKGALQAVLGAAQSVQKAA